MTTKIKDFGGDDSLRTEPITFRLYDEEFECRPELPGAVLLKFFKASADVASADSLLDFLHHAIFPDDWERFNELIEDPDRVVRLDKLGNIVTWLVEEYSGSLPTKPSRASATGRRKPGRGSTENSSEEALTS